MRVMPQTERLLGNGGVEFSRYYNNWPLCCPARTTLLTGQYPHNHGVRGNQPPNGSVLSFTNPEETLPVWLQRAGYRTTHIGKFLNGYGYYTDPSWVPPGWTDWHGLVDWTTYRMWGYTTNDNGTLHTYGDFNVEDPELYQTRVLAQKARTAIRRHSRSGDPFYVEWMPTAVHFEMQLGDDTPVRSDPRDRGKLSDEPLPDDPSIAEADLSDKPLYWQAVFGRPFTDAALETARAHYAGTLEALLAVDRAVASIVKTLRRTGELDNTYIIYSTDNGYFHGEHGIPSAKYFLYEPSSHLPLYMRGPGLPHGGTARALSQDIDMASTVLDMTGASPGRVLDGRSMLPFAEQPAQQDSRALLFSIPQTTLAPDNYLDFDMDGPYGAGHPDVVTPNDIDGIQALLTDPDELINEGEQPFEVDRISGGPLQRIAPGIQAIRTHRWIYWEYDLGLDTGYLTRNAELYDMRTDPYQLQNRAYDPAYAGVVEVLRTTLQEHRGCEGPACLVELEDPAFP